MLVGRSGELGVLRDLLAEVKAGVGGVVLVVGEQGVGKSSLLRAGLGDAEDRRGRLLWGVADELGQRIPLWLMDDVLAGVLPGDDMAREGVAWPGKAWRRGWSACWRGWTGCARSRRWCW